MAQNRIPDTAPATATLLAAYLAARYRVLSGDGDWLELEIGRPAPPALERSLPGANYTLISACNPQSIVQDAAANAAADAALRAELEALGLASLRTIASDADGRWEEPGWLMAGLDTATADALARRHGQAGILHWRQGQPVRLQMYRARPPGHDSQPWIDWVPMPGP